MSLLFTWYYWPSPYVIGGIPEWIDIRHSFHWDPSHSGIEIMAFGWDGLGAGVILFAIGSAMALITRFGFVPQIAGLLVFLRDFNSLTAMATWGEQIQLQTGLRSGYLMALTAVLICSFGTIVPIWKRAKPKYVPAISRVMALSPNAIKIHD